MKSSFISDTVVNRILRLLCKKESKTAMAGYSAEKEEEVETLVYNSFYFELFRRHGIERVGNWTENVCIDKVTRIIFPLFDAFHWSLCVVYPRAEICILFDPMRPMHKNLRVSLLSYPGVKIAIYHEKCVQQPNGHDCGPYTLYFAGCMIKKKLEKIERTVPQGFIDLVRR